MHGTCQTCLSDYQNQLNQFDKSEAAVEDSGELQVPQRFRDNMQSLQDQYQTLSSKDQQRVSKIAEMLVSWEEFHVSLEELTKWVRSNEMELAELRGLESFAMEFPSHKTRLQVSGCKIAATALHACCIHVSWYVVHRCCVKTLRNITPPSLLSLTPPPNTQRGRNLKFRTS